MRHYKFDPEPAAELLDVMAHPARLTVLKLISEREWDVGSLAQVVGLSQSALSQHLKKMRDGKFVTTRRDAQTVYYSSKSQAVIKMLKVLNELRVQPAKAENAPATRHAQAS
jgi:DNA-binding transcriptional ArsR family regulator